MSVLKKKLDRVPVAFILRVADKSLRYMDAYRQGATGRLAAFANKKYTSHRCLPASWLKECMDDYKAALGEKAEDDDNAETDTGSECGSSTEESDAADFVAAARADRSAARANDQIAVFELRAAAALAATGGVNAQGRPQRRRLPVNYSEDVQSQRTYNNV